MTGRLLVSGRFLSAEPTGLHRVARRLVDAADRIGWDRVVVAPSGCDDPLVDAHLGIPPIPGRGHVFEQIALPIAARGRPMLCLTNTAPMVGGPIVLVHDVAPLVGPAWFAPRMQFYGQAVIRAAQRARAVLTVSQAVADDLDARGVRGPIHVLRPGTDHLPGPADPATVTAAEQALGVSPPYILLIGWADPRKDAVTAVAASRLARRHVDHTIVLVGQQHPTFQPVVIDEDPQVRVAGYVDGATLHGLLTGASALLYPTRYEGFGLPPHEAAACGTPALVSDLPVTRESCGDTATFVPAGDVGAWADAITATLATPQPTTFAPRPWADAGRDLLSALAAVGVDVGGVV